MTELVINALKHAFPGDRGGEIVVGYSCRPSGLGPSVCADNGVGMPSNAAPKAGLGSSIVEALAKQLGATVATTDAAPGARVTITHRAAPVERPVTQPVLAVCGAI